MTSKPTWNEQQSLEADSQTTRSDSEPALVEPKKSSPNLVKLVGIVAVAGILGYVVGDLGKPYVRRLIHGPEVSLQEGPRFDVSLRGDEPTRGPKDALVTIVSFSDYECPHCAKAEEILGEFLDDWKGDPIRVVYKNYPLPLHENALPAAHAAWAAHMQQKFEGMHHWLFENRGNLAKLDESVVKDLGLDFAKFSQDRDAPATREAVDDDRRAGGMIHLRATPSFVVNGHIYTANWSPTVWEDVVNWERKAAQDLLEQGVKPSEVYKALVSASPDQGRGQAQGAQDQAKAK